MSGDWKSLKYIIQFLTYNFQSQTNVVTLDIDFKFIVKCQPVIFSSYQFICFIHFKIISQKIVVIAVNEFKVNNFEHIEKILLVQYFFIFFQFSTRFLTHSFLVFTLSFFKSGNHGLIALISPIQGSLQTNFFQRKSQN